MGQGKKENPSQMSGRKHYLQYLYATYPPTFTLREVWECEQARLSVIKNAIKKPPKKSKK